MEFVTCIITGVLTGTFVCFFGMWAFLKGQSAALTVKMGGIPLGAIHKKEKRTDSKSLSEQIDAMFKSGE